MRYQQYKNKMLKIKKVLMTVHHLRFVVIGVTVAIVASAITLDSIKGNITESSDFATTYYYGDKITYSGKAIMSDVSFEFKKDGTNEWNSEVPQYVGSYQARAKSNGSHGNKYSKISNFEIKPLDTPIKIAVDRIDFGNDSPKLSYSLINNDVLQSDYKVTYADLTLNHTEASIDLNTLHVLDKNNKDVTYCYNFIPDNNNVKEIDFNKSRISVKFAQTSARSYDGNYYSEDSYELGSGVLYYGAKINIEGGISVCDIGTHNNNHSVKILSEDGNKDYSANYDIDLMDNTIVINKANAIIVTTSSAEKTYDDQPFDDSVFTYEQQGVLLNGHHLKVEYLNKDVKNYTAGTLNAVNVSIVDADDNDVSSFYQSLTVNTGTLKINKRHIAISSNNNSYYFDNISKQENGFTYDDDELITGHTINLITSVSVNNPGTHQNVQTYTITRDSDNEDVSNNYVIETNPGTLTIEKKKLKFNFESQSIDYDGNYHNVFANGNKATLDNEYLDNLPDGWTYDVSVSNSMRYYEEDGFSADELDVVIHLYDAEGNDVTSFFTVDTTVSDSNNDSCDVTFDFPTSYINKINLDITTIDFGDYIYDDNVVNSIVNVNDLVSSTGLISGDELMVDYQTSNVNNPGSTRNVGDYSFNLSYSVRNASYVDVSSCYNWEFHNKQNYEISILKKDITIHTPNANKIYDATNVIPSLIFADGPDGEKITYNKSKTYTCENANVGVYTYDFDVADITISLNNRDVTNNYNINFVKDGQFIINKRPLTISQKQGTTDYIYFDNEFHGVFDGSNEVVIESQGTNKGLLNGHTLSFVNERKTSTAWDDLYYWYAYPALDNNEYFGTTIYDANSNVVTDNYEITYQSSIHVNIIKKTINISISSAYDSKKKVFDGDPLDLNPSKEAGVFYNIADFGSYYNYSITGYDGQTVALNSGHRIVVTKTREDIIQSSMYAGTYTNYYDYKVVDSNDNDVSSYYDIYVSYGTLTTYKLGINAYCGNNSKEYNSQEFAAPTGSFYVSESSKSSGAYIVLPSSNATKPFDKATFNKNFKVKVTFSSSSYPNLYMAGSYEFNATFALCNSDGSLASISSSSVEVNTKISSYKYDISKIDLKITSKLISAGKEMRYISYGKLANGDKLFFDDEEYDQIEGKHKLNWTSVCDYSHTHIMRGSVDVTGCYNLTIIS